MPLLFLYRNLFLYRYRDKSGKNIWSKQSFIARGYATEENKEIDPTEEKSRSVFCDSSYGLCGTTALRFGRNQKEPNRFAIIRSEEMTPPS